MYLAKISENGTISLIKLTLIVLYEENMIFILFKKKVTFNFRK